MDKSKQIPSRATDSDTAPIKFWGNIVIAALGILANVILLWNVLQLAETTISYLAMAFYVLVILAAFAIILLTIRGHQKSGAQLAFYATVVLYASGTFFYTGRALTASFTLLMVSAITIYQLLPKESRRRSIVITGLALMVMWVIEWINPSWRLPSSTVSGVGLPASILFGLILAVLVIRQSWNRIVSSIRIQITVWTGLLVVFLTIVMVTYSIITARQAAIDSAKAEALAIAEAQAQSIAVKLDLPLLTTRTLSDSLEGVTENPGTVAMTREQVNAMLKKVLEENPSLLGTYTLWEPNAFDGRDAQYANTTMSDNTGRFIPYWVRGDNGAIHVESLKDYETPGAGDWYLVPRATMKASTFAPLIYPIQGKDVVMASFIMPIVRNNKFYGITGVDAPITFVQEIVDDFHLYNDTANAVLLTDTGTLIAVHNTPGLVNKPATEVYKDFASLQQKIKAGEAFISLSPDGQYLRVFSPIDIGETGSNWSLGLVIPFSAITAPATASAIREVLISLGIIILSLLVLWYLTGWIVRPIIDLTTVANAISAGDLNAVADVQAPNETGVLAKAFNTMTSRLQEILQGLEQRVAKRTRNLELAAEVGRAVSQVRDLDVMLKDACELILKEFDLYYVQVYLTGANQKSLNLEAGTGEVGAQLLRREHSLPLDVNSINGRAAVEKHSVVISDTVQSATFRQNPLLPETRGEMAVPLIVADKVVGVLDMQSKEPGILNEEVLPAFEALAGQLAVAIQNANLLKETNEARAEVEKQARRLIRQSWGEYMDAIHTPEQIGFMFNQKEVIPLAGSDESRVSENAISSSISVTGEPLGSLTVKMGDSSGKDQAVELVNSVAQQMAQQIENLRLLESAERYRQKAEQAMDHTTLERWRQYSERQQKRKMAYRYDTREVLPLEQEPEVRALTLPIKARDNTIGRFSIPGLEEQDWDSLEIVNAIVERLSSHIAVLSQYDQTQSALVQSEKLFTASSQISQATDLQDLVKIVVQTMNIPVVNRVVLDLFQYNSAGELESMDVAATWWNGTGSKPTPIGTHYQIDMLRVMSFFISPTPLFFADTSNDERFDQPSLQVAKSLNVRSGAVLPLRAGSRQVGILMMQSEGTHSFTSEEIRLFEVLAPQITTVLENRRQFEQAQQQAEHEAMLNAISQKIQSATSVEAVLQIAARELGRALDASKAVAQLSAFKRNGGNGNYENGHNGNGHH